MGKNNVKVKYQSSDENYVVKKLISNNINFIRLKKIDSYSVIILSEDDYNQLLKIDYKKAIIFMQYLGIKHYKYFFIKNIEKFVISIILIFFMFLSNYLVIRVNIHSSDIDLKNLVKYKLVEFNLTDYSLKKDFNKIKHIKDSILNQYNDKIEWLEIKPNGYSYDVYIIKRKNNKVNKENDKCNYVATKSGVITSIIARKGVLNVQENNYVKSGDILISGDIIYNEELKNQVCASGKIMGEVWYKVNVSYPLVKKTKVKSSKSHKFLSFNLFNKEYKLTKPKYTNIENRKRFGFKFINFKLYESYKNTYRVKKISEEEALSKSVKLAKQKLLLKLPKNSQIVNQNILKKYTNNGKIYVEVLLTSNEELGVVENY